MALEGLQERPHVLRGAKHNLAKRAELSRGVAVLHQVRARPSKELWRNCNDLTELLEYDRLLRVLRKAAHGDNLPSGLEHPRCAPGIR
eukprot:2578843-Pyramimonas_sp.AAC.1